MRESEALNDLFRRAVAAIDAGDVTTLERLIAAHPQLVSARLETPGAWLQETVGDALNGFFARPYLLWFVAEDPVRTDKVPAEVSQVIRAIVDAARRLEVTSLQEQLDYTLRLVAWSGVAARCGQQLAMIDTLVDAGASPAGEPNNALVNGHVAAAERLIERGAPMTLAAALCLERWEEVDRLTPETNPAQRSFALVLSALNGKAGAVKRVVAMGVDVNAPSAELYAHGTPLHHAVWSGSLDTVRVLVEAGANIEAVDTAWEGTPLGWALHALEGANAERHADYAAIATYLQKRERLGA